MCWAERFSAKLNPKAWTEIPRLLYYSNTKAKEHSLPNYLSKAEERIFGSIPFQSVLAWSERHTVSFRIRTQDTVFISNDTDHYTTTVSVYICMYMWVCVYLCITMEEGIDGVAWFLISGRHAHTLTKWITNYRELSDHPLKLIQNSLKSYANVSWSS